LFDSSAPAIAEIFLMAHKFRLQQVVHLVHAPIPDKRVASCEDYEVVRLMPADATGEVSYRIRSGTAERAVREFEIKA
jgi:hypothetical protein